MCVVHSADIDAVPIKDLKKTWILLLLLLLHYYRSIYYSNYYYNVGKLLSLFVMVDGGWWMVDGCLVG